MNALLILLAMPLLLGSTYAVETADPAYQDALDKALKDNPPGDYIGPILPALPPFIPPQKSDRAANPLSSIDLYLLEPVDPPDKDIKILFSEAASYFLEGRWDLAIKRYKQSLFLDPENIQAKAYLLDILILEFMYESKAEQRVINLNYSKLKERMAKDVIPKEK